MLSHRGAPLGRWHHRRLGLPAHRSGQEGISWVQVRETEISPPGNGCSLPFDAFSATPLEADPLLSIYKGSESYAVSQKVPRGNIPSFCYLAILTNAQSIDIPRRCEDKA